jgi:hypothetical protein
MMLAAAAVAAALGFAVVVGVSPGRAAAGAEPWCVLDSQGDVHCNYATAQDCLQEVALSRGFCTQNSSTPAAPAPARGTRRTQ